MKRFPLWLLVVAVGLAVAADDPPKDDVAKEKEKLLGTWVGVSGESYGIKIADDENKKTKLVISTDKITLPNVDLELTYEVDPTKNPKTINVKFTKGPNKDVQMIGIYKLDKDTLTLCMDESGKDRPTKFETKKRTEQTLLVLKREKP